MSFFYMCVCVFTQSISHKQGVEKGQFLNDIQMV